MIEGSVPNGQAPGGIRDFPTVTLASYCRLVYIARKAGHDAPSEMPALRQVSYVAFRDQPL
jgi:hypothetical protein